MIATPTKTELGARIDRAVAWLDSITRPDGCVRRGWNAETGAFGAPSALMTGYAAHLFAWLHLAELDSIRNEYLSRAMKHAEWLYKHIEGNDGFFQFEPRSDKAYFFDSGIAARGLLCCARAVGGAHAELYTHAARKIVATMERHWNGSYYMPIVDRAYTKASPDARWSSEPGSYQLKAALAWSEIGGGGNFPQAMDSVSNIMPIWEEGPSDANGDMRHPILCAAEACAMIGRTDTAWKLRGDCFSVLETELLRADVAAQELRLAIYMDPDQDLADMLSFQSEHGGFWFARRGDVTLQQLSATATIFAIQAMAMSENRTPDLGVLTIV